jgi:hypothetical protein
LFLSLHNWQTLEELMMDGKSLTIISTAFGMGLPIAQAKRRTDTVES